jgi:hypothetical protein
MGILTLGTYNFYFIVLKILKQHFIAPGCHSTARVHRGTKEVHRFVATIHKMFVVVAHRGSGGFDWSDVGGRIGGGRRRR